MVHSIELLFDDRTDAALRGLWQRLSDAGLPGQARVCALSGRPHVTLTVAERIDPGADEPLLALADRLPLRCTVGAPVLFGSGRFILARLIVPSRELLDLQRAVHEICEPHMAPAPVAHTSAGQWTPHTTLCRRLTAEAAGEALAVRTLGRDLAGRFVGLRHWDGQRRAEHVLLS